MTFKLERIFKKVAELRRIVGNPIKTERDTQREEVENTGKRKEKEKRLFTIHGREVWLSKDQIQKEFGCPPEDIEGIWKGGEKAKPETAKPGVTKLPAKKKPSGEDVLALMRKLTENGIVECTSSLLRDKLNLDKESGRDQIRRLMRKLEKESKVIIGQKQQGKRKQYIFKLKEG